MEADQDIWRDDDQLMEGYELGSTHYNLTIVLVGPIWILSIQVGVFIFLLLAVYRVSHDLLVSSQDFLCVSHRFLVRSHNLLVYSDWISIQLDQKFWETTKKSWERIKKIWEPTKNVWQLLYLFIWSTLYHFWLKLKYVVEKGKMAHFSRVWSIQIRTRRNQLRTRRIRLFTPRTHPESSEIA